MKKKVLFFLLIWLNIGLIYFLFSNKKYDGVYVQVSHNFFRNDGSLSDIPMTAPEIFAIKSPVLNTIYSNFSEENEFLVIGDVISQSFFSQNEDHDFHKFNFKVKAFNKDSLVLTDVNEFQFKKVLLKMPKSMKNRGVEIEQLLGKSFEVTSEAGTDTIHFDEKRLYYKLSNPSEGKWSWSNWNLIHVDGLQFLRTDMNFFFVVEKNDGNISFQLPTLNRTIVPIKVEEIKLPKPSKDEIRNGL